MPKQLHMILEKLGSGQSPADFRLYACRGQGRGCPRNRWRSRKVHCDDCVPATDLNETLEHFEARMRRGDA